MASPEALVYGQPLSVFFWHVTPRGNHPYPSEKAVDDGPIIRCWAIFPATLGRQETPHYAPFRFAQIASAQDRFLSKEKFWIKVRFRRQELCKQG
jgi:hypothetical protein